MGFVRISDDLPSWEWFDDKNTVYVYLWLTLRAVWCDTRYRGIELKRGQIAVTYPEISEKCGVTVRQARTILNRLKATGKATVTTTAKFSIITLVDYDCNSKGDSQNGSQMTGKRQATRQSNDSPTLLNTNKQNNRNTDNARAREDGVEKGFDEFWNAYPKKTAKQSALKAWKGLSPDEGLLKRMLSSLERQKRSVQWTKDNGRFIPYPATWLNGKRWEDEYKEENTYEHNQAMPTTEAEWLRGFE